ncbi:MAG: hypothetical protein IJ654_09195 [Bacteroidales bacterium]|nr:hypothetical protein [Bacteroidales bacterium]
MKMNFQHLLAFLLLFPVLSGCRIHTSSPRPTIPLVERIINDPQSAEHHLLSGFNSRDPHGDIVLLDTPERCFYLSERFVTCDVRDNVDGMALSDQLPDFSGERITSFIDLLYPPYDRFLSAENASALREVTVRAALSAVDTACCLGPFDHERRSRKPSVKLIVLSSPYMAANGGFDLDTLFRSTGASVPVIAAPEAMYSRVAETHSGVVNIGVLSDSLTAVSGVFQSVFQDFCRKRGDHSSTVYAFSTPGDADSLALSAAAFSSDVFKRILDQYSKSGKTAVLTALVVDDPSVCIDSLRASYQRILNRPSDENAFYRKMLSKDFEVIDGARVVTDACYQYLRDNNLFTHNIAYPVAAAYVTSPEAKGYLLMDFDVNALPVEMTDDLQRIAPLTYKMYVQDQYHARGN